MEDKALTFSEEKQGSEKIKAGTDIPKKKGETPFVPCE